MDQSINQIKWIKQQPVKTIFGNI